MKIIAKYLDKEVEIDTSLLFGIDFVLDDEVITAKPVNNAVSLSTLHGPISITPRVSNVIYVFSGKSVE